MRWGLSLLLFFVLLVGEVVIAQDAASGDQIVTIYTDYKFEEQHSDRIEVFATTLISQVETQLASEGYTVIEEREYNPLLFGDPRGKLVFKITLVEEHIWFLDAFHVDPGYGESLVSRTFWENSPGGNTITVSEPDATVFNELATSFVIAHSYLYLDRCDLAQPFLSQVQTILTTLEEALLSPPISVSFHRANCAAKIGDYALALALYDDTQMQLERTYENRPTLTDFNRPYLGVVDMNRAWVHLQLGQREQAFNIIRQRLNMYNCTRLSCKLSNTFHVYEFVQLLTSGAQLYALGYDYDTAIVLLNLAIQLIPDAPELYTLRGQMWLLLYEWDNVLDDYNTAIMLDPTYPDAYLYRGVLYYSVLQAGLNWREEALADFEHYLELAPEGDLAEDAQNYADTLRAELEAING